METWFLFAITATIFAGLHVFIMKIGAVRGYNSSLLNSYSSGLSALLGLSAAWLLEGFVHITWPMIIIAVLAGGTYIIGVNMRMDAFRYADATILLPILKLVSPFIVLIFGLAIFHEILSTQEWIGVIAGMVVPLLLISRVENSRQTNLAKGLLLIVASATFAAISAALSKEGATAFDAILLFAAISHAFGAVFGIVLYRYRKKDTGSTSEMHFADMGLIRLSIISGFIQVISFGSFLLAFGYGGPLAIVYTIHSLYILIPIVLAIIFFKEHWNLRKAIAIVLSLAAIALLG